MLKLCVSDNYKNVLKCLMCLANGNICHETNQTCMSWKVHNGYTFLITFLNAWKTKMEVSAS